jgi:hypothetical protein
MRVGNDLDGCYDSFSDGVLDTLRAKGLEHLWKSGPIRDSYWNFYEDWGWDFVQFKELVDWGVDNRLIFCGNWRPGAVEAAKRIKALGHKFIIITDRAFGSNPLTSQENTIMSLAMADIEYDEIHFTADKTSVPVDIMVEDKLSNYDALVANGTPTYLINRAWNKVKGHDGRNRINSITDYADIVEELTRQGAVNLQLV